MPGHGHARGVDRRLRAQQAGGRHRPRDDPAHQRIIVNFYTAKRLAYALGHAVARHEAAFGTLETDVQKRVVAQPRA
ncbi:MAG: DUF3467 domain-containing protein [Planctomycetota bacterium]